MDTKVSVAAGADLGWMIIRTRLPTVKARYSYVDGYAMSRAARLVVGASMVFVKCGRRSNEH